MLHFMNQNEVHAVACIDCPHCGKEIVRGIVRENRRGFNSDVKRSYVCKHCYRMFTAPDRSTQVRIINRAFLDANYGFDALTLID